MTGCQVILFIQNKINDNNLYGTVYPSQLHKKTTFNRKNHRRSNREGINVEQSRNILSNFQVLNVSYKSVKEHTNHKAMYKMCQTQMVNILTLVLLVNRKYQSFAK